MFMYIYNLKSSVMKKKKEERRWMSTNKFVCDVMILWMWFDSVPFTSTILSFHLGNNVEEKVEDPRGSSTNQVDHPTPHFANLLLLFKCLFAIVVHREHLDQKGNLEGCKGILQANSLLSHGGSTMSNPPAAVNADLSSSGLSKLVLCTAWKLWKWGNSAGSALPQIPRFLPIQCPSPKCAEVAPMRDLPLSLSPCVPHHRAEFATSYLSWFHPISRRSPRWVCVWTSPPFNWEQSPT